MKLSALKKELPSLSELIFKLPNGNIVPKHFHLTEVGKLTKTFIDCGGQLRNEEKINFQLWEADDYDHRLGAQKLSTIIAMAEKQLDIKDLDIEVEYLDKTIGKYGLEFNGKYFQMTNTFTDCLAKDNCGIPETKKSLTLSTSTSTNTCNPGGGCC